MNSTTTTDPREDKARFALASNAQWLRVHDRRSVVSSPTASPPSRARAPTTWPRPGGARALTPPGAIAAITSGPRPSTSSRPERG